MGQNEPVRLESKKNGEKVKKKKVFEKRKKFIQELLGDPLYKPMRLREIGTLLSLSKPERKALYEILEELCEEGKVWTDEKGRYHKTSGKKKGWPPERKEEPFKEKGHRSGTGGNLYRTSQGIWICRTWGGGRGYLYS